MLPPDKLHWLAIWKCLYGTINNGVHSDYYLALRSDGYMFSGNSMDKIESHLQSPPSSSLSIRIGELYLDKIIRFNDNRETLRRVSATT